MKIFSDIVGAVATALAMDKEGDAVVIKDYIDSAYKDFQSKWLWDWRLRQASLQLASVYSTGTIAVSNASNAVTGTDTVWTSAMVDRFIQINGSENYYRIVAVTDGTHLILDLPFAEDSVTAGTYQIWKRYYPLPNDVKEVLEIYKGSFQTKLENRDFRVMPFMSSEYPTMWRKAEISTIPSKITISSIASTRNSNIITGTTINGFFTDLQIGDNIYLGEEDVKEEYNILKITSNTELYLVQNATRTVSSGTGYAKRGSLRQIEFNYAPASNSNVYYRYYKKAFDLINDNDEPEMPEEYRDVLYLGALVYAMQKMLVDNKEIGVDVTPKKLYDIRVQEIIKLENNKKDDQSGFTWGDTDNFVGRY